MTGVGGASGGRKIPTDVATGLPITGEALTRWRVRQNLNRQVAMKTPLEYAEAARQVAAEAIAAAQVAQQEATEARRETAEARAEHDALVAEEARRAAVRTAEQAPVQASSSGDVANATGTWAERAAARERAGVGPYARDPRHNAVAQAALQAGGIEAYNRKLAELEAEQRREKDQRAEAEHTLWRTASGETLTDGVRPPQQVSTPWTARGPLR